MIEGLWKRDGSTTFSPYNLRNIILSKNKYFENSDSEKIPEFIDFILDQLHKELKAENIQNINENDCFDINQNDNTHGFKNFYEKFITEKSIISELFFGYKEISYFCLNCQNNKLNYNYEIFKYIIFPLEDILDNYNSIKKFEENYKISIYDCFNIQYKKKSYKKEKNIHCHNCNNLSKCRYESQIYKPPEILIIILKRDKNSFINVELDFSDKIDITDFVIKKDINQKLIYDLYGIVSYEQNSGYESFCKNFNDNKWYKYEPEIDSISNLQKEVIENRVPYLLYYIKYN